MFYPKNIEFLIWINRGLGKKTIVTTLFYISSYNTFAQRPRIIQVVTNLKKKYIILFISNINSCKRQTTYMQSHHFCILLLCPIFHLPITSISLSLFTIMWVVYLQKANALHANHACFCKTLLTQHSAFKYSISYYLTKTKQEKRDVSQWLRYNRHVTTW